MKQGYFQPGEKYIFNVIREVTPDEKDMYWVLESPFRTRHLLQKSMYPNLDLIPGNHIQCRIDKINCSGRIFLEPENPYYQEGRFYDFIFGHFETITNSIGEKEEVAIVAGKHGENGVLSLQGNKIPLKIGEVVNAAVLRIKKGVLVLTLSPEEHFKYLHCYQFVIKGEGLNHKNNEVYILEDDRGRKCSIQKDNYKYYRIKPGDVVHCQITGFNIDGRCIAEPGHPYLKAGRLYKFRWIRQETQEKKGGEHHDIHIVRDYKGNEQAVAPVDEQLLAAFSNKDNLYKIIRFHKGKLALIPLA